MKLNYDREERYAVKKELDEWKTGEIDYVEVTENPVFVADTLSSVCFLARLLAEDCNTLEAEVTRLRNLYESDDLK